MKTLTIIFFLLSSCLFAKDNEEPLLFKEKHPASRIVQKFDTPWNIARVFLENPWRWSEAWENNSPPVYLVPGDQIKVVQKNGKNCLRYIAGQNITHQPDTVKLGPQISTSRISTAPALLSGIILPFQDISSFINHGIIFKDGKHLNAMPRILVNKKEGLFSFQGSTVYVKPHDQLKNNKNFKIYRHKDVYKDPDTSVLLGMGAEYIGKAHVDIRNQNLFRLYIDSSVSEVLAEDFLIPEVSTVNEEDLMLHPAKQESKIIALLTSANLSGQYSSVVIYGGSNQKIKKGELFSIYSPSAILDHNDKQTVLDTDYIFIGKLIVYKVFDDLSYALIQESLRPVSRGNLLKPS